MVIVKHFVKKFLKAKISGKTKVVLYGDSYIKFVIKYACMEAGLEFDQKEIFDEVLSNEVCLAGELNEVEVQQKLMEKGCFNFVEIVQNI